MEYCINCGTGLSALDEDPNGDKNPVCARCRAEESHDFDREPNVEFARNGSRIDTGNTLNPKEKFVVSALVRECIAVELNEYLSCTESEIKRFEPGDDRLTSEIMGFLATKSGEIDPETFTADAQNDFWQEALYNALRQIGYSGEQIGI